MKTADLLKKIEETNSITEREINLLKRRLNNGEKIDLHYIWNNEVELTPEQNKKGINFLLNVFETPNGKERKNSPFGYREIDILKSFKTFYLAGFHNDRGFYLPVYDCAGTEGTFTYYYCMGKVNIIG